MSDVIYSKVNDISDVELVMSNIVAQCDIVLDYITTSSDSEKNKLNNVTYLLMNLHDFAVVVEKQVCSMV